MLWFSLHEHRKRVKRRESFSGLFHRRREGSQVKTLPHNSHENHSKQQTTITETCTGIGATATRRGQRKKLSDVPKSRQSIAYRVRPSSIPSCSSSSRSSSNTTRTEDDGKQHLAAAAAAATDGGQKRSTTSSSLFSSLFSVFPSLPLPPQSLHSIPHRCSLHFFLSFFLGTLSLTSHLFARRRIQIQQLHLVLS